MIILFYDLYKKKICKGIVNIDVFWYLFGCLIDIESLFVIYFNFLNVVDIYGEMIDLWIWIELKLCEIVI